MEIKYMCFMPAMVEELLKFSDEHWKNKLKIHYKTIEDGREDDDLYAVYIHGRIIYWYSLPPSKIKVDSNYYPCTLVP